MSEDHSRVVALTSNVNLEPNDPQRLAALCGPLDQNLKHLEQRLGVHIRNRGNVFQVSGPEQRVKAARALLSQLYRETNEGGGIDPDMVHLFLQESGVDQLLARQDSAFEPGSQESGDASSGVIRTGRKSVKPRGGNQTRYTQRIRDHDVTFGIGPAGTGKTYLAVACAVEALESQQVSRIVLVRPAVEAGEKLGFLPGDLAQKIDPYLRPLYDALYEMMGVERVNKNIERNIIEVAPLAYMRGRTLNNAFIILDEGQNTTITQMKMFLTRIGFGSTAVITGDITQIDLPTGQQSGLVNVRNVLHNVDGISFTHFISKDVVRHPLVQKIVDAYEGYQEPRHASDGDRDAG
ncbi:MAG: PhoH family protein [Gammaproteobacteria bacterium]|nr:PhoH family protein [Gammaproteobacteria bacterium]